MGDSVKLMNFVSEQEVEDIKAKNGERVQDGTAQPQRPLFEILAEAKQTKDEEFKTRFKHLPPKSLDDEETEFLQNFDKYTREKEREVKEEESRAITEFQTAIASRTISIAEPQSAKTSKVDITSGEQTTAKKRNREQETVFPKFTVKPQPKRKKDGSFESVQGNKTSKAEAQSSDDLSIRGKEEELKDLFGKPGHEIAHVAAGANPLGLASYDSDEEETDQT